MGLSLNNKPFIFPQLQRIFWSVSEGALASALIAAGGSKGLMAFQVRLTFIALCTYIDQRLTIFLHQFLPCRKITIHFVSVF